MAEVEVVCPSGLRGMVRGWKTKEANILASKNNARDGTSMDRVLANCWLETLEPGPYGDAINGKLDWSKVLLCDRFVTLLQIRVATYGKEYAFTLQCEDRTLCGKRIEWEIDLTDLPVKALPDESRDKIASGENKFEAVLEHGAMAGKKVYFHLQTGAHEKRSARMVEGQETRLIVAALATRIIEVEGLEKGALVRFLDDLEMADLIGLMEAFDAADGGVETTIEVDCPHCGLLQEVNLPFGREYFLPMPRKVRPATTSLDRL